MKPVKRCCLLLLVLVILLSGCQASAEQETIALRIVDGAGTGTLVLAGQSAGEVFTVNTEGITNEVYSLPMVKFHAAKWRAPLGAYGFSRCTALWPELGTWSGYQAEAVWIS